MLTLTLVFVLSPHDCQGQKPTHAPMVHPRGPRGTSHAPFPCDDAASESPYEASRSNLGTDSLLPASEFGTSRARCSLLRHLAWGQREAFLLAFSPDGELGSGAGRQAETPAPTIGSK